MPDEPQRPVAPKGQADPDPSSEPRSSVATEPAEGQQSAPATRRRRRRRGGRGRGRSQSGSGPAAAPAEEATSEEPKATTGPKASPADEAPDATEVTQPKARPSPRRRRRGRFWQRVPFTDLAALRKYLSEHLRFVHRAEWVVDGATRKRHASDQFVLRRAVRYELLEALRQ